MAIFFRPSDFRRLSQGPPGCTPKGHFEGKIYMKFIPKKDRGAFMIHPKLGIIPKAGLPEFLSKYTKMLFSSNLKVKNENFNDIRKFEVYYELYIILRQTFINFILYFIQFQRVNIFQYVIACYE